MNKTTKISLFDLYEIKKRKDLKNTNVFNHILDICNKKIKHIAEHGGMCVYFKVPPMILGYPLYEFNSCIEYLIKQLKLSGLYAVQLANPNHNYLYISWKLEDLSHKAKSKLLLE